MFKFVNVRISQNEMCVELLNKFVSGNELHIIKKKSIFKITIKYIIPKKK